MELYTSNKRQYCGIPKLHRTILKYHNSVKSTYKVF